MPFRGVADPDDLAILRQALDEYCAENGIDPKHPDRELIAFRIMALFTGGVTTVDELKRILRDGKAN